MYKPCCSIVILFVFSGCGSKPEQSPHPTVEQQIAAAPGIDLINNFIDEKDPWTRYYKAWDFVKSQAQTSYVAECDPPAFIQLHLAKTATDWSRIEGTRRVAAENPDPNTLLIEITSIAFGLPWAPAKEAITAWQTEEQQGSRMLEWRWADNNRTGQQNVEFWFRMKTRESFIAD